MSFIVRITVHLNEDGQLHYFVNGVHRGVLINNIPYGHKFWLIVELFGNTYQAKLIPAGIYILMYLYEFTSFF